MDELFIAQAADKIGPRTGGVWSGPISIVSAPFDIMGAAGVAGVFPKANGRIVAIAASVDIYFRWGDSAAETVDGTATSPSATVGFPLAAGNMDEHVPTGRYLIVQGSAGGIVWLAITSSKSRLPIPTTPVVVNT